MWTRPWGRGRRSRSGCRRDHRRPHCRCHRALRSTPTVRTCREPHEEDTGAARRDAMARVLVVEDEEAFSDALSYMLRKEGFEVSVAGTGTSALTEFDRSGADIVLLDLMLPEMSGTEVCRQLRQRSHVPIIMVTARDSEIDKVVGLEIGADDYVTKPYSPRELVARIRAVLRRQTVDAAELSAPTLAAGPVRMDVERHVVTVDGEAVQL